MKITTIQFIATRNGNCKMFVDNVLFAKGLAAVCLVKYINATYKDKLLKIEDEIVQDGQIINYISFIRSSLALLDKIGIEVKEMDIYRSQILLLIEMEL